MNNILVPVLVVSVLCIFVFIFNLHLHNYRNSTKIIQATRFLTNKLSSPFLAFQSLSMFNDAVVTMCSSLVFPHTSYLFPHF